MSYEVGNFVTFFSLDDTFLNLLLKQNEANKQYADICKKIRQLYKKQEFKFAT